MSDKKNGLTIISLSYQRTTGLATLMDGLLKQTLNGLEMEYIVCNNSNQTILRPSFFTKIGRRIKKFNDIKILNSSHNYRCQIRYQLATLAKHETILFLDDDVVLLDNNFIFDMWQTYQNLSDNSILSCWCTLWTAWQENSLTKVDINFRQQIINELMLCDTAGPGISMFNKTTVMHPRILDMTPEFKKSDDMGFSLIANLTNKSQVYYFPSWQRLKFHDTEKNNHAISKEKKYFDNIYAVWKSLWQEGYKPVLERLSLTDKKLQLLAREKLVGKINPW